MSKLAVLTLIAIALVTTGCKICCEPYGNTKAQMLREQEEASASKETTKKA